MTAVHRALALALVGLAQDVAAAAAPYDAGPENTAAPKPHLVYILSDNLYVSHGRARSNHPHCKFLTAVSLLTISDE